MLKRRLYRWWRQGKALPLKRYGDTESTSVIVEFESIGKTILIQKNPGEPPDDAITRYLSDFVAWQEKEEAEGDRPTLFRVVEELIAELHYQFLTLKTAIFSESVADSHPD